MKRRSEKQAKIMQEQKISEAIKTKMREVINKEVPAAVMIGYDSKIEEYYKEFIEPMNAAEYEVDKMEIREQLAEKIEEEYKRVLERRIIGEANAKTER